VHPHIVLQCRSCHVVNFPGSDGRLTSDIGGQMVSMVNDRVISELEYRRGTKHLSSSCDGTPLEMWQILLPTNQHKLLHDLNNVTPSVYDNMTMLPSPTSLFPLGITPLERSPMTGLRSSLGLGEAESEAIATGSPTKSVNLPASGSTATNSASLPPRSRFVASASGVRPVANTSGVAAVSTDDEDGESRPLVHKRNVTPPPGSRLLSPMTAGVNTLASGVGSLTNSRPTTGTNVGHPATLTASPSTSSLLPPPTASVGGIGGLMPPATASTMMPTTPLSVSDFEASGLSGLFTPQLHDDDHNRAPPARSPATATTVASTISPAATSTTALSPVAAAAIGAIITATDSSSSSRAASSTVTAPGTATAAAASAAPLTSLPMGRPSSPLAPMDTTMDNDDRKVEASTNTQPARPAPVTIPSPSMSRSVAHSIGGGSGGTGENKGEKETKRAGSAAVRLTPLKPGQHAHGASSSQLEVPQPTSPGATKFGGWVGESGRAATVTETKGPTSPASNASPKSASSSPATSNTTTAASSSTKRSFMQRMFGRSPTVAASPAPGTITTAASTSSPATGTGGSASGALLGTRDDIKMRSVPGSPHANSPAGEGKDEARSRNSGGLFGLFSGSFFGGGSHPQTPVAGGRASTASGTTPIGGRMRAPEVVDGVLTGLVGSSGGVADVETADERDEYLRLVAAVDGHRSPGHPSSAKANRPIPGETKEDHEIEYVHCPSGLYPLPVPQSDAGVPLSLQKVKPFAQVLLCQSSALAAMLNLFLLCYVLDSARHWNTSSLWVD
jgi:hypothetical protein